jgi:hypothetical protein
MRSFYSGNGPKILKVPGITFTIEPDNTTHDEFKARHGGYERVFLYGVWLNEPWPLENSMNIHFKF